MLRHEASGSAGIIKYKESNLHPGELIAGIFIGQTFVLSEAEVLMATSLCHSLERHANWELYGGRLTFII